WSPDGKYIAFEAHVLGNVVHSYLVSAEGGPLQEFFSEKGEQSVPAWSPDGATIAVALNPDPPLDSTEQRGIFLVDWRSRKETKLPESEGLTSPMWSPDGKYFIAKTDDETAILVFDPAAKKFVQIATASNFTGVIWSSDSKFLYA